MWRRGVWLICLLLSSEIVSNVKSEFSYEAVTAVLARINVSYLDRDTKRIESSTAEIGRFAEGAVGTAGGVLVTGRSPSNSTSSKTLYLQGCYHKWATPPNAGESWVALLLRGGCSDEDKVKYAMNQNASAVLLYGNDPEPYIPKHTQFRGDTVVVYLLKRRGEILASLVDNGTKVYITITKGQEVKFRITSINRTSVLFVSVSFIVLMVVSLAWLIFYYIQRFRYINAKDRLAKHLNNAAKKALAKIPVKNIKNGEKEIDESESCAVCIELYQVGDTLRSLPCKHEFHKGCVDPWLLEHRTCPMCKMDILKYYGYMPTESENPTTNGPRTGDSTTSGANGTPTLVLGSARRSRNQTPSSARTQERRNSQLTLQVSVISHTNSVNGNDNIVEPSAPNIPNDISSSIPTSSHPISLASTTAIIRSVILSSNTQPAPVGYSNASLSDIPPTTADSQDGSVVVNIGEGNQDDAPNEQNKNTMNVEGVPNNRSPFEEDQGGDLVEVLAKKEPLDPSSNKTSRPISSPSGGRLRSDSIDSGDNPSSEIDRLVNEIIDAERDDFGDMKGSPQKGPPPSLVDFTKESEKDIEGLGASAIPLQPQNNCPTLPSNFQSQLPVVDCNTQVSIPLTPTTENYPPRVQSRNLYSSNTSEDFEEMKKQDATRGATNTPPDDGRRPSSHLVTISHS